MIVIVQMTGWETQYSVSGNWDRLRSRSPFEFSTFLLSTPPTLSLHLFLPMSIASVTVLPFGFVCIYCAFLSISLCVCVCV